MRNEAFPPLAPAGKGQEVRGACHSILQRPVGGVLYDSSMAMDKNAEGRSLFNHGEEDCAFCKIVRGEVPNSTVFEDGASLAFLDRRPLFPGHCLLIPRQHFETLLDLPASLITALFSNAQLLARAVELALGAEGSFVAVNNRVSQSVPHFHIHVVPRRKKDGLKGFFWPRQKYKDEAAMREVQGALRSAIDRLRSRPATEAM